MLVSVAGSLIGVIQNSYIIAGMAFIVTIPLRMLTNALHGRLTL